MEVITSKSNEKVKFIRSLNDRKFRQEYKAFYIEGIKVIDEILENEKAVNLEFIAYSSEILTMKNGGDNLIKKIENKKNIERIDFSKSVFEYMCDTKTPQGVLAVIKMPLYDLEECLKNENKNIILLDKVQDLGNIGTIIRNCAAFDIDLILCRKGTADVYSNKVTRSTMGTILKEKIIYLDNVSEISQILKRHNFSMIGTSLNTRKYINDLDFAYKKFCFVLGNEANGISEDIIKECDELVKIPMCKSVESLNVSVASGIILYKQFIDRNN